MPTMPTSSRQTKWAAPRPPQERRTTDNSAFYNSQAWRRTSKAFRLANPLCAECERNGFIEAGTCVDHIKPIEDSGPKFNWANLQTLCNRCHAVKSGKEAHKAKG